MTPSPFRCYLIGNEALLMSCADELLATGHAILGVISQAPAVASWCREHQVRLIPPKPDYTKVLAEQPFAVAKLRAIR